MCEALSVCFTSQVSRMWTLTTGFGVAVDDGVGAGFEASPHPASASSKTEVVVSNTVRINGVSLSGSRSSNIVRFFRFSNKQFAIFALFENYFQKAAS